MNMDFLRKDLFLLNSKFKNRQLSLSEDFYNQLESCGFDINNSFLVEIVPDGGNTYFGTIINQLLEVFTFDIDMDFKTHSKIKKKLKQNQLDKFARELAALECTKTGARN